MKSHLICMAAIAFSLVPLAPTFAVEQPQKPNIVLIYADDISAREMPIYGSSMWSKPEGGDTSDPAYRGQTPVLDRLATEGCWVKTAWAAVVCSPSRAMMMTGRYAHLHKWWGNGFLGTETNSKGRPHPWPLYESSPNSIGHVAQQGGYATFWAGKTQMKTSDLRKFGFDEGVFTPGEDTPAENPHTDFQLRTIKVGGNKTLVNVDTGEPVDSYQQSGWYWKPHVRLMNHPDAESDMVWWPNTPESEKKFGLNTYGPDVELDFIFDFMDRQQGNDKPFFIYHTSHLGHDAYDWLHPESTSKWPGTPVIKWDGESYKRTTPNVTGDEGVYDTHGTITKPGIHNHINYLDYQVWLYLNKFKELGIAENTILIFCADNGTSGYGKNSPERQKGTHVPLIVYAPGMTKQGAQDVLVNMSDMLPTVAELAGVSLPVDYEINGESLVPFLFTDKPVHREWVYGYKADMQIIRGSKVMKDGFGKWWNVDASPDDLISFNKISDWNKVSAEHRDERDRLNKILPGFDLFATQPNAPGEVQTPPAGKGGGKKSGRKNNEAAATKG